MMTYHISPSELDHYRHAWRADPTRETFLEYLVRKTQAYTTGGSRTRGMTLYFLNEQAYAWFLLNNART